MNKVVFLSGPITGLSYDGATGWREYAVEKLGDVGITALSPLRRREFLKDVKSIADHYDDYVLSTKRGITAADRFDLKRADLVIMNVLGAKRVSIGTMIEAGWADAWGKPIILIMEKDNIHKHCMLDDIASFQVETLLEALTITEVLMG